MQEAQEDTAQKLACALHNPAPPPPVQKQKGHKPLLNGEDLIIILDWIKEQPLLTLRGICNQVKN